MDEKKIKNRIMLLLMIFIALTVGISFFNYQIDDEVYIGFYDYDGYPDNANFDNGVVTVDESTGLRKGDVIAEVPAMHVDAGKYILDVDHQNDHDFEGLIYDGETVIDRFILPSTDLNTRYAFTSADNLYNLKIVFTYNGTGSVTVKRSVLYSDGRVFYYDTIMYALILIIAACLIARFLIKSKFFLMSLSDKVFWSVIILFTFFSNYPFFRPFDTPAGGDIGFHISRIEGIYRGLAEGQLPALLYPDVMHGRGMIGALYPHLFFAFPAVLRLLHISMEGAFRIFLIAINTLTCATAYFSAKIVTRNRNLSLLTMILYILLPYRLSALTWRYAYGEALAYIFLPLVYAGVYEIAVGRKENWPVLCLGLSGVIESHVVSSVQMAVFCFVVMLCFIPQLLRERRIFNALYAVAMTLLINLWFIASFLYYYNSDINIEVQTAGDMPYISYFFSQMLQMLPNNTLGRQLNHQVETMGIWLIFILLIAIYLLIRKAEKEQRDNLAVIFLGIGLAYVFATTKTFPWETLSKFKMIYSLGSLLEFPTRLYLMGQSLLLFGSVIIISGSYIKSCNVKKNIYIITMGIALLQGYIITDSHLTRLEPFIDVRANRYTPDIGDMIVYDFYAPYEYDHENFRDYVFSPNAAISDYHHKTFHTEFKYTSPQGTYVDVPLTYFLGYKAKVLDDGTELYISKGDMGCIRISLPENTENVQVSLFYAGYKYGIPTIIVSVLSLMYLIAIMEIKRINHSSSQFLNLHFK